MFRPTNLSNQKFLDAFLAQEENQQLCQRVIASPDDTQKRNELNSRIQEFYAELQLIKYISSLIRFTAIELAVRTQKIGKVFQPTDEIERVLDSLVSDTGRSEWENKAKWEDVIADKRVLDAVQTLTEKEREILALLYLRNLKEVECCG